MSENLNLLDIIKIIAKWWWIIVITAILGGSAMYTYSEYFADDIYISKGSFYISSATQDLDNITISMLNANSRLTETYIELAKSDSVLEKVKMKLIDDGYKAMSASSIRQKLSFSVLNETEVLEVRASDANPYMAQALANAVLSVAPQEINRIVKAGGADVVDTAKLPTVPAYPNVLKNTLSGFLVGVLLGLVAVFLFDFFDLRIKPDTNLEKMYGIPVIGNIPGIRK